ncbi:MAG: class I SAM-dependent methyltransferase [Thermotoga sp.]|nr:MAG: class I SAM-dependent methyltransferase [Thermotoga sp.]
MSLEASSVLYKYLSGAMEVSRLAHSWEYYDDIASIYDSMYMEPYWILYHLLTEKLIEDDLKKIGFNSYDGLNVLDLGSGTGRWSIFFALKGAKVWAVDPSREMLNVQRKKLREYELEDKIQILHARAEVLPFKSGFFDVVNAQGDVLSYVENLDVSMREIRRVLKSPGVLLASVDSFYDFANSMLSGGSLRDFHSLEKLKMVEIGDLNHSFKTFMSRVFTVEDVKKLEDYGFELLDLAGKVVFGPYDEFFLAKKMDEILEIEYRYCRVRELIGKSEHIHFSLVKKE